MKNAKIERLAVGTGGATATVLANSNILADTANPFGALEFDGTTQITVAAITTVVHTLPVPSAIDAAANTITFDTPVARITDVGKSFVNPADAPSNVVSVSADRKTYTLVAVGSAVKVAGCYTTGAAHSDEKKAYTITEIDAGSVNIAGIPADTSWDNVTYSAHEYLDVEFTDPTNATPKFTVSALSIIMPALLTDESDGSGDNITIVTDVRLQYRSLKTSLALALTRIDISDYAASIATNLGTVTPYNTGAYAVYEACKNSNLDVYFTGVDAIWFTNRTLAMTEQDAYLRDYKIYHIVPTSMLPAVHTVWDSNQAFCSTPAKGKWRKVYISRELQATEAITDETTAEDNADGFIEKVFHDIAGTFVTDGAASGDTVKVNSWGNVYTMTQKDEATTSTTVDAPEITWDGTTLTILANKLFAGGGTISPFSALTAVECVGRVLKITTVAAASPITLTSADTSTYTDDDHATGNNGQTFAELGYMITRCVETAADTEFDLAAVGNGVVLAQPNGSGIGEAITFMIYDGLLSANEEALLLRDGLAIDVVSDEVTITNTAAIKNWGTTLVPVWHEAVYSLVDYEITSSISKDDQATFIAAYAQSMADRRMQMVWPDRMYDANSVLLRGYFLAAATAGKYSGMPVQESLTRHYFSAGNSMDHSAVYFSSSQLNTIAEGGVTIMTQAVAGANVLCRHQQTTDRSTIYYAEPSITHSIDKVSYMVRETLDKLIGVFNITDQLFDVATTYLESIKKRVLKKKPRVGGILKYFDVIYVRQDPTDLDYVEVNLDTKPNVPCNGFNVTIKVN